MLRLLFGFWIVANVRTKEQRKKDNRKQIICAIITVAVLGWFRSHPLTDVGCHPESNLQYAADSGHTIVYDANKDQYSSNY